jgi:hypothetical protein
MSDTALGVSAPGAFSSQGKQAEYLVWSSLDWRSAPRTGSMKSKAV